jgi:hypothetical protein
MTAADYFDRPVKVGDVITSVCWSSNGFPQWATYTPLTVVKVNRTRVVVESGEFNGTFPVLASCACIIERDGPPDLAEFDGRGTLTRRSGLPMLDHG